VVSLRNLTSKSAYATLCQVVSGESIQYKEDYRGYMARLLLPSALMDTAPTGSGKTVLFELAIIHMLVTSSARGSAEKCVYMAPTKVCSFILLENLWAQPEKALCAERTRDWSEKFGPLGIRCT
jgi:hypothetical protein